MEASEYIAYLLSEAGKSGCVRSAQVLQISHDKVNRFLATSVFDGHDLFDRCKVALQLCGGVLSVDDTVIDKPKTIFRHTEKPLFMKSLNLSGPEASFDALSLFRHLSTALG